MDQYRRLSDTSADSSTSDHCMNIPAGVISEYTFHIEFKQHQFYVDSIKHQISLRKTKNNLMAIVDQSQRRTEIMHLFFFKLNSAIYFNDIATHLCCNRES